jgi:hypothetical protein
MLSMLERVLRLISENGRARWDTKETIQKIRLTTREVIFNFLPFYHMGFRTSYPLSDKVTVGYMLVNGIQQTEELTNSNRNLLSLFDTPIDD